MILQLIGHPKRGDNMIVGNKKLNVKFACLVKRSLGDIHRFRLYKRFADREAHGEHKCVGHRAADEDCVGPF